MLRGITAYNFTKREYIAYWTSRHKRDKDDYETIITACEDKLKNGLIDTDKMIELVNNSSERKAEKQKIIRCLTKVDPKVGSLGKITNKYILETKE